MQSTGKTLFEFIENGDFPESVEQDISENKIDINDVVKESYSPLIIAAQLGRVRTVRKLIDLGAQVNAYTMDGDTALIEAAHENQLEVMLVLIEKGADIDFQDQEGYTALMWATEAGHIEAVTLLIKAGADINRVNKAGQNALDISISNNCLHLARKLASAGAQYAKSSKKKDKAEKTKLTAQEEEVEEEEDGSDEDEVEIGVEEEDEADEDEEGDEDEEEDEEDEEEETWLTPLLTECGTPAHLIYLCEEKLVRQEGFGCAQTLARVPPSLFHRAYLEGLGVVGLGLQQVILDTHGDLHHEYVQQKRQNSGTKPQHSSSSKDGARGTKESRSSEGRSGDGPFTHTRFGTAAPEVDEVHGGGGAAQKEQRSTPSHKEVTPGRAAHQKDGVIKSAKKRHSAESVGDAVESEGVTAKRQTPERDVTALDM
jgi:hypothetical protein